MILAIAGQRKREILKHINGVRKKQGIRVRPGYICLKIRYSDYGNDPSGCVFEVLSAVLPNISVFLKQRCAIGRLLADVSNDSSC
jgi:hypothetical protein